MLCDAAINNTCALNACLLSDLTPTQPATHSANVYSLALTSVYIGEVCCTSEALISNAAFHGLGTNQADTEHIVVIKQVFQTMAPACCCLCLLKCDCFCV